jgi:lantibiotic transport system ATP-binding protein
MENPVRLQGICKSYGKLVAIRRLDLTVPPRSVYGFLGPNGAGKSTTIRIMLGLQRPTRGSVLLFGRHLEKERVSLLRRCGSLVESPSLYPHLTGRENLEIHRALAGLPKSAIQEALAAVDLTADAQRPVRGYSSGMKQRLGIAQALLGNPELLILDEPTNALDPAGIHEIRDLIRDLPQRRGVTVFLSSHLLGEVEQIASHIAIISRGEVKFEGTRRELSMRSREKIVVQVDQPERAESLLASIGHQVTRDGCRISVAAGEAADPAQINAVLVQAGIAVSRLSRQQPALEDFFLQITAASSEIHYVAR